MSTFKKKSWVVIFVMVVLFVFMTWYKNEYSMTVSPAYSVNTPEASTHLLIATQGSDFKYGVVEGVINHFKKDDVFIRVIDVSDLSKIESTKWDAVFVFHTWEYGRPPGAVKIYADKQNDFSNLLFYATSRVGDEYIKGIDGISSASILSEVDNSVAVVIEGINKRFQEK